MKPGADRTLKKVFSTIGVPEETPFQPDPFQLEAVSAVQFSDCLVTAPTGSGKTWIAEQAIASILNTGGRAWYASPLKALTNSKYAEFTALFGKENTGILTGDRKENPEARIVTGTTEILRNQLYDAMHRGEDLAADFVILDEAHFLGDEERGVVWEEIMIYLPHRIPLLMLSATIGNADQIAAWLESIRNRKCTVVKETKRPVPLYPLFFHPSGTLLPLMGKSGENKKPRINKKVLSALEDGSTSMFSRSRKLPPMGDMLRVLKKYNLLPAIFFLKSRADCDKALDLCADFFIEDKDRKAALEFRLDELANRSPHIAGHRHRFFLENFGVGSHHSGQLPAWKLVLETLMSEGLMNAVFATSTVAAGVNFPARTVLFFNSDRYNGKEFAPLSPTEFHQMTGRAGRRGMDNIGFAVAVPSKFMEIRLIGELISSEPSDVASQIRINFSMTLNLLLSHTISRIEDLLKKSFAAFLIAESRSGQSRKRAPHMMLWNEFLHHVDFLKETGYVTESGALTEDGIWASRLRVDYPLLIAETLKEGLLPISDPALLSGVMASFVYDADSDERLDEEKQMYRRMAKTLNNIKNGIRPFVMLMLQRGFPMRPLFLRPAIAIHAWADGRRWEQVVSLAKMPEGNLAMLILRTADNLRHVKALSDVFPEAAEAARLSILLLMRDPVSAFFAPLPEQEPSEIPVD